MLLDRLAEGDSVEQLHHVERVASISHFMHRDDPRMLKLAGNFGFVQEALSFLFRYVIGVTESLDRDFAIELSVDGLLNHSPPATPDFLDAFVPIGGIVDRLLGSRSLRRCAWMITRASPDCFFVNGMRCGPIPRTPTSGTRSTFS